MNEPIKLDCVMRDGKVIGCLQPMERVERAAAVFRQQNLEAKAEQLLTTTKAMRENSSLTVKTISYDFTPYTYGQELEARRGATIVDDRGQRTDYDKYNLAIMCICLGKSTEAILSMEPALFRALREEIALRCDPSEDALLFFALPPTSSGEDSSLPEGTTLSSSPN